MKRQWWESRHHRYIKRPQELGKYNRVIEWIDKQDRVNAFAFHILRESIGGNNDSLYKILHRLRMMGYLKKLEKGFMYRLWLITSKWTDVKTVTSDYELYMTARLSSRSLT